VHTDKDHIESLAESLVESAEDLQEKSLSWLLDMDLSEPEEKLFALSGDEAVDLGLTAYEAEVAGRPLFRGNTASDDLATYVDEEIVISSESEQSDIYRDDAELAVEQVDAESEVESMAIDFSRRESGHVEVDASLVSDGADILGLADDDDMGEKFLSIKRVKHSVSEPVVQEAVELSEAPIPMLVDVPAGQEVANESLEQTLAAQAPVEDGALNSSLSDYVAGMLPPMDDEEFDHYLLAGEHLLDGVVDPDDLVVQLTEGIVSVDPAQDFIIDYHEDFRALEGLAPDSVAAITAVISPLMEEISSRARERMTSLGLSAESLEIDVMLGGDPESIKRCYAGGFEPVTAVFVEDPVALGGLSHEQQEAIYVRLFHGQTNESWNDFFSADFSADMQEGHSDGGMAGVAQTEEFPATGFGQDMLDDGFLDDLAVTALDGGPQDIEAIFGGLLGSDDDAEAEVEQDPMAVLPMESIEQPLGVEGFGDELFVGEFADELPDFEGDPAAHIDAAFASLSHSELTGDAICGVEIDEFAVAEQADEIIAADMAEAAPEADGVSATSHWCIPQGVVFNYASQGGAEVFTDFLDAFIEEGSAEVEKLEDAVGEWEKDITDQAALATVTRTLHTLKGIGKGVGLQCYGTLVHNFETLLESVPQPKVGDEHTYFRMLNAWLDAVVRGLEYVREQRQDIASEFPVAGTLPAMSTDSTAAEITAADDDAVVTEPLGSVPDTPIDKPVAKVDEALVSRQKKRDQKIADDGAKALAAQQSVRITSEKLDHLLNLTSQAQQLGVRSSQGISRGKRASAELQGRLSSVRSHIAKIADRALLDVNAGGGRSMPDLDALEMDQYSELQEAASILREGVEDLADLVDLVARQNGLVEALLKQQASVVSGISSSIQAARVVPVSRLMPGLRRIVRTVSTDLNKAVSFKVLNEVGALDRDHYARCQVILEHMVRNALDHGIETPEERLALGKPTAGRITIDVRKSGGDYLIRLSDDGRGIDADGIRESAYEKGLDVDVDALSDEEAIRLIFHKGFSTANTLSEISGRGVGMDIVMTELQQLGGDIQIQSAVGLGTSFEVRIPSNVSVNGALLVTAGNDSYAIPLNGLVAVEHVPVDAFYGAVANGGTLSLFDMDCEPAYLATLCQGESLPEPDVWGMTVPVIIAGSEERYMAIAIDDVEEALELVVRSLGAQFSAVPGVAGAATTADGEAIVALDLNLLAGSVAAGDIAPIAVEQGKDTRLLALVVDDSRTQRMVTTSQLDTVGVETITAENGMVAIDLLNATHRLPDIVLLDVEMPVKDGIETLREIRKSLRYGHLPVIMVTSRTGAKHRAMAREAGCNGYMGKPFNFPVMIEQISELTGHELQLS
jgi:chemotaxis protein histidine kinase CheA